MSRARSPADEGRAASSRTRPVDEGQRRALAQGGAGAVSAELLDWQDEHRLDHRRRVRTGMTVSLALHGLLLALFAASPPRPMPPAPSHLAVDLVSLPAARAPRAAPRPQPAPEARPAPAPEPAPPPPAPPAPPVAKAPVQVLPEETPGRIREAKPEPAQAKAEPTPAKPEPKPAPRPRRQREKALSYEEAMKELGDDELADLLAPAPSREVEPEAAPAESSGEPGERGGVEVSPEQLAWDREVRERIRRRFPNQAQYSGRGLVAQIEIVVTPDGRLEGPPRLVSTSGNVDYDRTVLAVVERAARERPLPPPPRPGARRLNMKADER